MKETAPKTALHSSIPPARSWSNAVQKHLKWFTGLLPMNTWASLTTNTNWFSPSSISKCKRSASEGAQATLVTTVLMQNIPVPIPLLQHCASQFCWQSTYLWASPFISWEISQVGFSSSNEPRLISLSQRQVCLSCLLCPALGMAAIHQFFRNDEHFSQ